MIYNNLQQLNQELPVNGRLMGLDVGTKTIGVAISDLSRLIATPRLTISRKSNLKDFFLISQIIIENNINAIVIGLPLNMDDSESPMSAFVRKFADNLDKFLVDCKIIFHDERLSSFIAENDLSEIVSKKRQKQVVDQVAAALILQSVLDEL